MGKARIPEKALLFLSVLYSPDTPVDGLIGGLPGDWGGISSSAGPMPFTFTDYYSREMGSFLSRLILAFSQLVDRDGTSLVRIKTATCAIEDRYRIGGKRRVNLDPGILSLENVCLATTKPHSHRIYLGNGIWADLTLIFCGSTYRSLPWTYPDYASAEYIEIFNDLRAEYKRRIQCLQA